MAGGKSFALRQAWEERLDSEPEPTGLKWTGAAVWDAAVILAAFLHANSGLIQVTLSRITYITRWAMK